MKPVVLGIAAALFAGNAMPLHVHRPRAAFCSLVPLSQFYTARGSVFVGTATADSLPAKARKLVALPGQKFPDAAPYAQIITVERLSIHAPTEWMKAVKAAGNRVVTVPWSYDPACRATTWDGPNLWTQPGTRGLFAGGLRSPSDWIDGIPTIDVGEPMEEPYPFIRGSSGAGYLSADEFLSMVDSLPLIDMDAGSNVGRYNATQERGTAILDWAKTHRDQAGRKPLSDWVATFEDQLPRAPFDTIISAFAGTYRFVMTLPGRDSIVFFGRTQLRPREVLWTEGFRKPVRAAGNPYGYYLYMAVSSNLDSLPVGWPRDGAFMGIGFDPMLSNGDSVAYHGIVDVFRSLAKLATDPEVGHVFERLNILEMDEFQGGANWLPGRAVQRRDGSVSVSSTLMVGDSTAAKVVGERISRTVFESP